MATIALGSVSKEELEEKYEKKQVGLVDVVTGKTKAKFTLLADRNKHFKTFKGGETSITVNFDDLPSRPRLKPEQKEPKTYRIRMSQDGTEIEAITPAMGHFKAKLVDLGKRDNEDADPVPFMKQFKEENGKVKDEHLEFFAVYEIIEGMYKGVQLPALYLHYKFEEDPNHEGYTRFAGNFDNAKSTRLFQLRDWGVTHDIWSTPIEWDDTTILPELLDRALRNNKLVDLTIKDGYIRELLPVQTEDDDEELPDFLQDPEEDELDEKVSKVEVHKKPVAKKIRKSAAADDEDL